MKEELTARGRAAVSPLKPSDIPFGTPLPWAIVSSKGDLLLDPGAVFPDAASRAFFFHHFDPHRRIDDATAFKVEEPTADTPPGLDDIGLSIGARIGLRGTGGIGPAVYASRVIGFSAERRNGQRSLFVTQPVLRGSEPLDLSLGEQVDIVALTGKGVFRFASTVDVICREPFAYAVLSAPGFIRRLRARRFPRMQTRLAARYRLQDAPEQIGRVSDISPYGMSLTVMAPNACIGDRLRVAFAFNTDEMDVRIDASAIVRHVGETEPQFHTAALGLEFETLEPAQRVALKAYMAEHA